MEVLVAGRDVAARGDGLAAVRLVDDLLVVDGHGDGLAQGAVGEGGVAVAELLAVLGDGAGVDGEGLEALALGDVDVDVLGGPQGFGLGLGELVDEGDLAAAQGLDRGVLSE